jgi:hypothetical protein
MKKHTLMALLALTTLVATPTLAYADITAFFGVGHRPDTRMD